MTKLLWDDELDGEMMAVMADALRATPVPPKVQNEMAAKIKERRHAGSLANTLTVRKEEGKWMPWINDIEIKLLHQDPELQRQTALWRLHPGAVIPAHVHQLPEECLVLEGAIESGGMVLRPGDFHVALVGCWHAPITSTQGALLLIQSDMLPTTPA